MIKELKWYTNHRIEKFKVTLENKKALKYFKKMNFPKTYEFIVVFYRSSELQEIFTLFLGRHS